MRLISGILIGWIIATLLLHANAEPSQTEEPVWSQDTDCTMKQIDALKAATNASLSAEAELALMKAEAYGQLKNLVGRC